MNEADRHIPKTWLTVTVDEIASVNPRGYSVEPTDADLVSFVRMAAIEEESGRIDASIHRTFGEVRKGYTRFEEGDVIVAKITPCMENGKFAVARGLHGGRAAGTTELHVLRPHKVADASYLLYYLLQESTRSDAQRSMRGAAGQLRVPESFLADLTLPLAPLAEQHRIVAAIEEHLTNLDAAVAALKRAQANLKRYRAAVLDAAVTGRLVGTDNGHRRPSLELMSSWESVALGELCAIQGGIQKQPSRKPVKNRYPFLRVANVYRDRLVLDEVHEVELFAGELDRLRLQRGDLLIVEGNGSADQIGRAAVWDGSIKDCVHQNHLIRARPGDRVLPKYLSIFWNSPAGSAAVKDVASSTTGLFTLSVSKISRIAVPVPPLTQQRAIGAEVERRLSAVDRLEAQITSELKRAARLRRSILKRAFEGKLVPQDPNDEPASVLIERIRSQRTTTPQPATLAKRRGAASARTGKRGG